MTKDKFTRFLKTYVDLYTTTYADGVAQNRHMNECKGVQPSKAMLDETLAKIVNSPAIGGVKTFEKDGQEVYKIIDVLKFLSALIVDMYRNSQLTTLQEEAIAVDFVNFVGMKHCVDYAMYTCDLKSPRTT
jgi:hypothetical protein